MTTTEAGHKLRDTLIACSSERVQDVRDILPLRADELLVQSRRIE